MQIYVNSEYLAIQGTKNSKIFLYIRGECPLTWIHYLWMKNREWREYEKNNC